MSAGTEQRQKFQPEFFRNLHHARDILLLLRTEHANNPRVAPSANPNGIPSPSPGLRATLGHHPQKIPNRNAVAGLCRRPPFRFHPRANGRNLVEVVSILEREPKVGAGVPTLGWRTQSRWDWTPLPTTGSRLLVIFGIGKWGDVWA
jgi:hypothetical protein